MSLTDAEKYIFCIALMAAGVEIVVRVFNAHRIDFSNVPASTIISKDISTHAFYGPSFQEGTAILRVMTLND